MLTRFRARPFPELNPNPMLQFAANGALLYANPAARALLFDGVPTSIPIALTTSVQEAVQRRTTVEFDYQHAGRLFILQAVYEASCPPSVYMYGFDQTMQQRLADELRERTAMLARAQRLEALGKMANGVAHDFNNLLTVLMVGVEGLCQGECYTGLEPVCPHANDMVRLTQVLRQALTQATEMVQRLLAFGRQQNLAPHRFSVCAMLRELEALLTQLIQNDHIVLQYSANIATCTNCWVFADRAQLEQAVINLVVNACDAMPHGGQLSVILDDSAQLPRPGISPMVRLIIQDTGSGMSPETLTKAIEPYFTTKVQGSGLGLSTAYGVVTQSQGVLAIESQEGIGTTITIELPLTESEAPAEPAPLTPPPATAWGASDACVLIVEDNELVREVLVSSLAGAGYRVLAADSASQAIERYGTNLDQLALLITDIHMPGIRGDELAVQFLALHPGLRVLFISGSPSLPGVPSSNNVSFPFRYRFLAKPFTVTSLLQHVAQLLTT